jgi:hypothetical protein
MHAFFEISGDLLTFPAFQKDDHLLIRFKKITQPFTQQLFILNYFLR